MIWASLLAYNIKTPEKNNDVSLSEQAAGEQDKLNVVESWQPDESVFPLLYSAQRLTTVSPSTPILDRLFAMVTLAIPWLDLNVVSVFFIRSKFERVEKPLSVV